MEELLEKYNKLEELRNKVKNNEYAMEYYEHLKSINRNDLLYGWLFNNDSILVETLEDLDIYQNSYINVILNTYIGELENILYKVEV